MTNIIEKYLRETLRAIYSFSYDLITVERVRRYLKIKGKDRSKVSFITGSLKPLERKRFLKKIGSRRPLSYKLNFLKEMISIPEIIFSIMNDNKVKKSPKISVISQLA